mmetsp:Transcript_9675/g.29315  ORF Transcript_9675/g.29315 Transcript_9675/m.29315 type:complete len:316 (+) Transcript_9675:1228-2175(+)
MPERRGDGEHWIQAAQHGAVHQHLADARIDGHAVEMAAERRQLLICVKRAHLGQHPRRAVDGGDRRRRETALEHSADAADARCARQKLVACHALDQQRHALQRAARHLWARVGWHRRPRGSGEHAEAHTGTHTARAATPLLRGGPADPSLLQPQDAALGVVRHLLSAPAVDDERDVVDRDRRLRHVGRDDDLGRARGRARKDLCLVARGQRAVQRQHTHVGPPARRRRKLVAGHQRALQPTDLRRAREEHQHRAARLLAGFLEVLRRVWPVAKEGLGPLCALPRHQQRHEVCQRVVVDDTLVDTLHAAQRRRAVL